MPERATVARSQREVSRGRSSWATSEWPNEKESWRVMGSASHQKSGQPERVVTGRGEDHAEAARDEARPAYQQEEGLGRGDLFWQALSRENMAAAWKRVKANTGSAGLDGLSEKASAPRMVRLCPLRNSAQLITLAWLQGGALLCDISAAC